MNSDLSIPNIRKIETSRTDLYAYEVTGHLASGDVANVYGLLEEAYAQHDKIDLFVRLTAFEGVDWDIMAKKSTYAGEKNALKHIRRYAVVGGPGWIATMIGVFDPFFSIEMKHFSEDHEDDAWAWLDETDGGVDTPQPA